MIESPVLIFCAHPDDETLLAGGTIARFASEGVDFAFAVPVTGIAGRFPLYHSGGDELTDDVQTRIETLRQDCDKALQTLGVPKNTPLYFGGFPDNRMDDVPRQDLNHWLEDVIENVKPRTILTHAPQCQNVDHRRCYEAAMVATRQSGVTVLSGEVPGSTGVLEAWRPNFYVGLAREHFARKIAAMESYKSERRESPHPRSPVMLISLARVRGSECGCEFAEAFEVARWVT